MDANPIPEDVAAAIEECWPDGIVGEFDTAESYFHDIHADLEDDLAGIHGATLMWQTDLEDPELPGQDWQSYHAFFMVPRGSEFEFDVESETQEEPDEAGGESITVTCPGTGWYGWVVAISLASPFAAMNVGEFSRFEDGGFSLPDLVSSAYFEETGEPVDSDTQYLASMSESARSTLERLRAKIAAVLDKNRLVLLSPDILDLPAPGIIPAEGMFMDEPLAVRDAFFSRGA